MPREALKKGQVAKDKAGGGDELQCTGQPAVRQELPGLRPFRAQGLVHELVRPLQSKLPSASATRQVRG